MKIVEQTPSCLQLRSESFGWMVITCLTGLFLVLWGLSQLHSSYASAQMFGVGMLVLGSVAILIGCLSVEWLSVYSFNKNLGTVSLKRRYVLHTRTIERKLRDIRSVQVVEQEDSDRSPYYAIQLWLSLGEKLHLAGLIQNPNRQEYELIAERIRRFLELST